MAYRAGETGLSKRPFAATVPKERARVLGRPVGEPPPPEGAILRPLCRTDQGMTHRVPSPPQMSLSLYQSKELCGAIKRCPRDM